LRLLFFARDKIARSQEWLGHATLKQTSIYARFKTDDLFDAPIVEKAAASLIDAFSKVIEFKQST